MSGLEALAKRCEDAAGPDHALDRDIWLARYGEALESCRHPYTHSLDAAMGLVPNDVGFNLDRYWIREGLRWKAGIVTGGVPENPRRVFDCWDAHTAALATCAAALRAHLATDGGKTDV